MIKRIKQGLIALFFLGQLAAVYMLGRPTGEESGGDLGPEEGIKRYGFYLTESAKEAGLDFRHEIASGLDERLQHILPLVSATGASVSIVDYDRDGLLDVFVVNSREGSDCALFRNLGGGKFRNVTREVGLDGLNKAGSCQGAIWGDFHNDGFEGVLVYKWGRPELFRNVPTDPRDKTKGRRFENVSDKAGLPKHLNANAAVWLDYDRDGHLDLFLSGYWPDGVDLWKLESTRMMPESFQHANNGGRKHLLRNRGDGTFEDVTEQMGISSKRWTLGVAAADLCGSGYPDLVLANDYGVSEYYCNRGGKRFEEIGAATGIGHTPKSGMSINFGDMFNVGQMAMYVTNIDDDAGNLNQGNNLWVPRRDTPLGQPAVYNNQATQLKIHQGGWAWGAQFGDLNNDGWLDLFQTNGMISAPRQKPDWWTGLLIWLRLRSSDTQDTYWFDYGKIAGANTHIISDAANWPAMRGRSLSGNERKRLWLNRGDGAFALIGGRIGVKETFDGRAVALADLGNRGVLDVLVACQNGPLLYYKNSVKPGRGWVQFDLEGTKSNRSAIGALVRLYWTNKGGMERQQVQCVEGGNGYASQNMRRLHFGLGDDAEIIKAVIHWPSGFVQTIDTPKANMLHSIKEPTQ